MVFLDFKPFWRNTDFQKRKSSKLLIFSNAATSHKWRWVSTHSVVSHKSIQNTQDQHLDQKWQIRTNESSPRTSWEPRRVISVFKWATTKVHRSRAMEDSETLVTCKPMVYSSVCDFNSTKFSINLLSPNITHNYEQKLLLIHKMSIIFLLLNIKCESLQIDFLQLITTSSSENSEKINLHNLFNRWSYRLATNHKITHISYLHNSYT